ncbi:oxysterol-binding protein-related protein 10 isoform X1 [Spea bombifrons]|uniref:oxysterol-binding protein-related protein 10 isoform X1 n=1 Tax=Spea bombifrons TaxID=233779 RepID=UPI00234BF0D4|nr:oxysterol-binding protein-related protein 10 isoform X1 [Spea bombifrons]
MEKASQQQQSGGGSSNSSSRSSSRATSAGSSPSSASRGLGSGSVRGLQQQQQHQAVAAAGKLDGGAAQASKGGRELQQQRQVIEGSLNKYTNLIQGWQNRYFVLDFDSGILQYFVTESSKNQKPRGSLSLTGSVISTSDESPCMIIVYSASGEMYKLKASDSNERQFWLNNLQACAKYHTESKSSVSQRSRSFSLLPHGTSNSSSPGSQRHLTHIGPSVVTVTHHKSPAAARRSKNQSPPQLHDVKEVFAQVEGQQRNLAHAIESLSGSGPLSALDQDLLLLKATSAATLSCLGECLHLLQQSVYQVGNSSKTVSSDNILSWHGPKSHSTENLKNGSLTSLPSSSANLTWPMLPSMPQDYQIFDCNIEAGPPEAEDELTDTEDNEEEDLGVMDDQRSVILHLISQLKLGMDLTKVVLPTFILEKRSLLEMYANFMAHPDVFLAIAAGTTPEERMISFVEYYLTAFHEGRKGAVAKKPYNPIIGETFHCSWDVPKDKVKPCRTHASSAQAKETSTTQSFPTDLYKVRFVAEQVSHHPPVSCFYCESKEKKMCVNAHVWTKSKFLGMSVGVSMVGEGTLKLMEYDEDYVFTLPSAYARSILTVPWVELGGKINISCAKTGYLATVTFQTKPFYGGKVHRVTAEVKHNPTNTIVCKAQGEWNGTLEFTYSSGETKVIDTTKLPVIKKKIRPLEKQGPFESRRVWENVTNALKSENIEAATEHKHQLEERQRAEARQRASINSPWKPKYFIKEGDGWVYVNPLWKQH